jgi:hypothetical protein
MEPLTLGPAVIIDRFNSIGNGSEKSRYCARSIEEAFFIPAKESGNQIIVKKLNNK